MLIQSFLLIAAAASAETMQCPPGTAPGSETYANKVRVDYCKDATSGIKRGPYRQFSADNVLQESGSYLADNRQGPAKAYMKGLHMAVLTYDRGEVVARRFTLQGLKTFAGEGNSKGWQRIQLKVIDETTFSLDFLFGDVEPAKTAARRDDFRKNLLEYACPPFSMFEQIQIIEVRVLERAGVSPETTRTLKRQDCIRKS